jgi:2-polyprenyl-3-methyl-5-hydroxy-6-metoxy-1,4-benzoquinol methylase
MAYSPCGKVLVETSQAGVPILCRWRDVEASLSCCPGCGYLCFDPVPSRTVLDEYYASQYWEHTGSMEEAALSYNTIGNYDAIAATVLDEWSRWGAANGEVPRVHEVGCGYGATVYKLRQQGINATGSDLAANAIAIARKLGNAHVHDLALDQYLETHISESINVFLMCHVLEHMLEPDKTLKAIHTALPVGGLLVLRVPNGLHITSRGGSMHDFTWLQFPDHIHYFTPKSVICQLMGAGFEVLKVSTSQREDNPWLLTSRLFDLAWDDLPNPGELLSSLAANWMLMELQVVARKADPNMTDIKLIERATMLEADYCRRTQTQSVPAQNGADFATLGTEPTKWCYFEMIDGVERPMTISSDCKSIRGSAGGWALRTMVEVPARQGVRLARTMPDDNRGVGILELQVSIVQPFSAEVSECRISKNDHEVCRLEVSKRKQSIHKRYLRALVNDRITIDILPKTDKSQVFYVHVYAAWLSCD